MNVILNIYSTFYTFTSVKKSLEIKNLGKYFMTSFQKLNEKNRLDIKTGNKPQHGVFRKPFNSLEVIEQCSLFSHK